MESIGSAARYPSPLRYPGGKGKVANFLKLLIINNDLTGVDYVEPYAGGASVALSLLFEEYVDKIHINDLNAGIYNFWKLVLENPEALCRRVTNVPLTMEEWRKQRAVYSDPNTAPEDLGFATFYLNRTNRSGIIPRGGVIGGNDQTGSWQIDARFNRQSLCARIQKVSRFNGRIKLTQRDAKSLIRSLRNKDGRLLYLDPPYYIKGSRLYDNFYEHADHVAICKEIRRASGPWVVSYDAVPPILDLYSDCEHMRYVLGYSASRPAQGTEVMFFSDDLDIPIVLSPAGISHKDLDLAKMAGSALF